LYRKRYPGAATIVLYVTITLPVHGGKRVVPKMC
jgi:hypothetical protein